MRSPVSARPPSADTIAAIDVTAPIHSTPIDPPTLAITVSINDSPLAGRDGDKVQSRVIRDRLLSQAEKDVAIRVRETEDKDAFEVAGRGELQLGVLLESMRREGFEVSVSRPQALTRSIPTPAKSLSRSKKSLSMSTTNLPAW